MSQRVRYYYIVKATVNSFRAMPRRMRKHNGHRCTEQQCGNRCCCRKRNRPIHAPDHIQRDAGIGHHRFSQFGGAYMVYWLLLPVITDGTVAINLDDIMPVSKA